MSLTHHELEQRASTGDRDAFGELIRRYDHELRGVVWTVLESTPATDDVMQNAYLKAFRGLSSFTGRSSIKTWLHSICYNAAIDFARSSNIRRHEPLDSIDDKLATDSTDAAAIARVSLEELLSTLPGSDRAMLMLTLGLGYSYDETAEIVGRKRGTVASTVNRARKKLTAKQVT